MRNTLRCVKDSLTSPSNVRAYVGDMLTIVKIAKKLEVRGYKVKIDVVSEKKSSKTFLFVWTRRQAIHVGCVGYATAFVYVMRGDGIKVGAR